VGASPCPQQLGRFTIANTGGGFLEYQISSPPSWLELVDVNGSPVRLMNSLSGGEQLQVTVRFTCAGFGSLPPSGGSRTLGSTIRAEAEDGSGNSLGGQNISITLTLQN